MVRIILIYNMSLLNNFVHYIDHLPKEENDCPVVQDSPIMQWEIIILRTVLVTCRQLPMLMLKF